MEKIGHRINRVMGLGEYVTTCTIDLCVGLGLRASVHQRPRVPSREHPLPPASSIFVLTHTCLPVNCTNNANSEYALAETQRNMQNSARK